MSSRDFELTHAAIRYAAACAQAGDWTALRDASLGEREAEALANLTLGQLQLLEQRIDGHVLRIAFDREALWMIIEQARDEAKVEAIKRELMRRDAPQEMMEQLFGMGQKEYACLRRSLRTPRGVGRPPEIGEEIARRIWLAWGAMGRDTSARPLLADWLTLADETGICLRTIWRVVQRWFEDDPSTAGFGQGAA